MRRIFPSPDSARKTAIDLNVFDSVAAIPWTVTGTAPVSVPARSRRDPLPHPLRRRRHARPRPALSRPVGAESGLRTSAYCYSRTAPTTWRTTRSAANSVAREMQLPRRSNWRRPSSSGTEIGSRSSPRESAPRARLFSSPIKLCWSSTRSGKTRTPCGISGASCGPGDGRSA